MSGVSWVWYVVLLAALVTNTVVACRQADRVSLAITAASGGFGLGMIVYALWGCQ